MNAMRSIKIDKMIMNIGAGREQKVLEKGELLIKLLTGLEPVKTITQKRIPGWSLRPGVPVGLRVTIRGKQAEELLKNFLAARDNVLPPSCVDDFGNVSFGVPEYIEIPGVKYDPQIGIMGFQVSVTLMRPGYRVARRKLRSSTIPRSHRINKEDAVAFMQTTFNTEFNDDSK